MSASLITSTVIISLCHKAIPKKVIFTLWWRHIVMTDSVLDIVYSAVLTYVATVAWPQGPALLGAPRFCRPHFQNLLCAFSSARHVHHDPRNLISLNHREKGQTILPNGPWNVRRDSEKGPAFGWSGTDCRASVLQANSPLFETYPLKNSWIRPWHLKKEIRSLCEYAVTNEGLFAPHGYLMVHLSKPLALQVADACTW